VTWTYTPDFTTTRDQVRFLAGDTDTTDQLVTDEEVAFAYAQEGSTRGAAALLLEGLAKKFARKCDSSVGDLSKSYSQMSKAFGEQAKAMRRSSAVYGIPVAGGISISRVETVDEDTDRVTPAFRRGMLDNPTATESIADEEDD